MYCVYTNTGLRHEKRKKRLKPKSDIFSASSTDLQIVVVTAEVRGGVVFHEKGTKPAQEAVCGPVLGHRPHGVVAGHQQEVRLGPSQSQLQPRQLAVGVHRAQRPSGLLVHEVVAVAAQQDGVQHDDGQRLPGVGDAEVQLIIVGGEVPMYTAGTESIQTPLHCSLFVSLQPFAKIKKCQFISH